MLDKMRRNVRRLSWTLWLVIAAFIILYFPDFFAAGPDNEVARVDGQVITLTEYRNALNEQMNYYRGLNNGDLPENFVQQIQLHNVVVEQLVRRKLILAAARDQGFEIAPQEIRDRLVQFPAFIDESGRWIGVDEYRNVLARSGIDQATFEQNMVEELLVERVTGLLTEGIQVSDSQLQELYQRQNERVRFDYIQVRPTAFQAEVLNEIDDAALRSRYTDNTESYRLPERRKVSYAVVDTEALRDVVTVDDEALRAEYEASLEDFTTDEQVKARQIVVRVAPDATEEDRATARAAAEAALARVRGDEDFAAVAEEVSDDPSSATGGDLGWVTRGRQVEGWDEAGFALEAGAVSEVTETPFGFVIIQVDERRDARVQPFEEVSGQLEQRLAWDAAEARAAEIADEIRAAVLRGSNLPDVAESHSLTVEESPLFGQDAGFGEYTSREFTSRAFSLGAGRVAEPLRVRRGYLVFRVDEIEAAHLPEFEDVVAAVRSDEAEARSIDRARERAAEFVSRIQAGEELAAIAEEATAVVDSTDLVTRDEVIPALGRAPGLMEAAFEAGLDGAGGPLDVNGRFVVFRVVEHQLPDWTLFAGQSDELRDQEAAQQRNRLFEAYIGALRDRYAVTVNQNLVDSFAG
ncbi:MAG: hypothetical protein GKS06_04900 [Acidobacteria bacterium]|nr:hypothetical protein [Acidobacteriota bacterium]